MKFCDTAGYKPALLSASNRPSLRLKTRTECATDVISLSIFQLLSGNITGKAGATTFTNVGVFGDARRFYRIRVEQ
jgi:hypothetical protein